MYVSSISPVTRSAPRLKTYLTKEECKLATCGRKLPRPALTQASLVRWGHVWRGRQRRISCAADIAKDAQLVVCHRVARLLFDGAGLPYTRGTAEVAGLTVGPELDFAPIKGLEDQYNVGAKDKYEYLKLREITCGEGETDLLLRRHQQAKVLTEFEWVEPTVEAVTSCQQELRRIVREASFFRLLGLTIQSGKGSCKDGTQPTCQAAYLPKR